MADIFKTILDISLAGSALALLAMAARLIIGRRPNAVLPLLSALLILRLAIPAAIPSPLSVMNLFQGIGARQPVSEEAYNVNETAGYEFTQPTVNTGANTAENTAAENDIQIGEPDPGTNVTESNAAEDRPTAKPLSAMEIASIVWIAGMTAMAACVAASNIRFTLTLKKNRKYDAPGFGELLEQCKAELNVRSRVEAVQLSGINTAAVYGIFRPKLLISPSLSWLSDEEKKHVLLHELSHIKRRDTFICLLITALSAVYWFNPVIWIALAFARRDMEIMCDMAVLKLTQDKRSYASTLFSLAKAAGNSKPKLVSALFIGPQNALRFGVLVSTDSIKRRMKMIKRYRKSRLFTAVSLILVFAIAITGCTGAVSPAAILPLNEVKPIAQYSLDISVLPEDTARKANIEKAAGLIDGLVLPAADVTQTDPDLRFISVETESRLGEMTETNGWRTAPSINLEAIGKAEKWIMIHDPETRVNTNKDPEKFNNEIFGAETANKVGGGVELVMLAVCKAASAAGIDYYMDYYNDGITEGLGPAVISNVYPEDYALKVWVNDNKITAAIYKTEIMDAMHASVSPALTDQKLVSRFIVNYSGLAGETARVANIEKAALLLDGTVFPHWDASLSEEDDYKRQINLAEKFKNITSVNGWQKAPFVGWDNIGDIINTADGNIFNTDTLDCETTDQVGGGLDFVIAAAYGGAISANMGGIMDWQNADKIWSGGAGTVNGYYDEDVTLKIRTEDNMIIAEYYVPRNAKTLMAYYSLDYGLSIGGEILYNVEKAMASLNGKVIRPGGQLSLNEVLGERSVENGWKKATSRESGCYISMYGFGVDAVASALYNASLRAGLATVNVTHLAIKSDYIFGGLDATISNGSDLVISNPYNSAITINTKMVEENITFRVYGPPRGYTVDYFSKKTGEKEEPLLQTYVYNAAALPDGTPIPKGESITYSVPVKSATYEVYRIIYKSGESGQGDTSLYEVYTYPAIQGYTYVNLPDPSASG